MVFARQVMGRPYLAPPHLPAERLATLRQAFMDTMADKDFLAEAAKAELEINPVSGADVENLVKEVYATPPDIIAKAKAAAAGKERVPRSSPTRSPPPASHDAGGGRT